MNARLCRERCLGELDKYIMTGEVNESIFVQRADVMRRAGMFDRLLGEYESVKMSDAFLDRLIAFELEKTKAEDVRCYRVSDVTA